MQITAPRETDIVGVESGLAWCLKYVHKSFNTPPFQGGAEFSSPWVRLFLVTHSWLTECGRRDSYDLQD